MLESIICQKTRGDKARRHEETILEEKCEDVEECSGHTLFQTMENLDPKYTRD